MPLKVDRLRQAQEKKLAQLRKKQDEEKVLKRQIKDLERNARTHRLCQRAGILESYLKEPLTLEDEDISELIGFIFSQPEVKRKEEDLLAKRREKIIRGDNTSEGFSGDVAGVGLNNISRNIPRGFAGDDNGNISQDISGDGSAKVSRDDSLQEKLELEQVEAI